MMNPVLQSIEAVIEQTEHVRINYDKAKEFAQNILEEDIKHWMEESPVNFSRLSSDERLAFLFVFNSISFSYWGNPKWTVEDQERGTWSMLTSLQRALEEEKSILNPDYLANLKQEDLERILRGNVKIPMLEERLQILRELGKVVSNCYNGNFANVIVDGEGDVLKLLEVLVNRFPSFNDSSTYHGEKVYFHKRAQLLISDISYAFGNLTATEQLTACADYILPMGLRYFRVLEYSPEFTEKIDNKVTLNENSEEVNENRMATILAVEKIAKERGITSMQANDYIWNLAPIIPETEQYMLVRTTKF